MLFMKIYFTILIIMAIVSGVSWFLFNVDEKREDLWFKVTLTSVIVMLLMVLGLGLYSIWC
jgi:heme/copper-type cytochrome/quinol oxidase subunit 4